MASLAFLESFQYVKDTVFMTSSAAGRALPTEKAVVAVAAGDPTHEGEPHAGGGAGRLNWLRAGVLGANDGIVSVAGIVVGVAGATIASALSFTLGALLPLLAILLPPAAWRVPTTFVAVLIALAITGVLSARLGGSNARRAVIRVLIGGTAGLAFTYGIGALFGAAIS